MKKVLIIILLIVIGIGGYLGVDYFLQNNKEKPKEEPKEEKKLQIFDETSNSRIIAVMINNNHNAWPHYGLQDSFLNYEIIAEGGITRIMALYKDKDTTQIGSVRSSRPYYLDYVLENDAIYVHWGASDEAYSNIKTLNIDNLDGMYYENTYFYRDRTGGRGYEHSGFTKMSMIKEWIEKKEIRNTTEKENLFNYTIEELDITKFETKEEAHIINIPYSNYHTTSYTYDETNKVYIRSMSDETHIDASTNKAYTAKNIITYKVKNYSKDSYGRQELENIGSGEGYYITNGYAIPITWEKKSRSSQTIYKYKETGEEIELNDGNTWVQIQPENKYLEILSNNIEENE